MKHTTLSSLATLGGDRMDFGGQGNERPSKRRCSSAQPHREVGLMRSVRGDKSSGFVGSASGIYFIRSVYGALRQHGLDTTNVATPASDVVPGEDDQLTSVLPQGSGTERLWRHNELNADPGLPISYQDLIGFSGSFFTNWHTFYPFLHAPTVLVYLEAISHGTPQTAGISQHFQMVIVRSIMSISLADQRQAGYLNKMQYPAEIVFASYDAAVDSLQHVLTKPTSILGLQAAISVQLFLVSMLRLNAASRIGGLINRMALQLGLHRCPARYGSFSIVERELRQRVFWSLYAIDRFLCQSMGLPLGINDDDVDVCYPLAEKHMDGEQDLFQDNRFKILSFVARESRLRGEIIELRNKSVHYVHKDPDQAIAISAKLAKWWNKIEDLTDEDNAHQISPYNLAILTLLKHESIISLYRPVLAASRRGVEYDAALQLCVGSARSIISILHDAVKSKDVTAHDHESLTLLWPSCTWAIWISTFILFFAANEDHLSHETVIRLADRSIQVLQHLARRGSAWPEASAAAIRDLRSRMINTSSKNWPNSLENAPCRNERHAHAPSVATEQAITTSQGTQDQANRPEYGLFYINSSHSGPSKNPHTGQSHGPNYAVSWPEDFVSNNSIIPWNDVLRSGMIPEQSSGPGTFNALDPFSGFDIPFWFEQDQYWNVFSDFD